MMDPIASKPLDEAVWQAWTQKNRSEDSKGVALRMKVGKGLLLVVLPVAAVLWILVGR